LESIKKNQITEGIDLGKSQKFIISSTLRYVSLFGVNVKSTNSYLIMPQAKLKEETPDQIVFDTDLQAIVVNAEKLGNTNTFDYAIKYINEQRLIS
jgi:hypothetical protein